MPKYVLKIEIECDSPTEVKKIGRALNTIINSTTQDDLIIVSDLIEKDPKILSKVKKLANNPMVKKFL